MEFLAGISMLGLAPCVAGAARSLAGTGNVSSWWTGEGTAMAASCLATSLAAIGATLAFRGYPHATPAERMIADGLCVLLVIVLSTLILNRWEKRMRDRRDRAQAPFVMHEPAA